MYSAVKLSMFSLFAYLPIACLLCDAIGQQEEGSQATSRKGAYRHSPQWSQTYFHQQIDSPPVPCALGQGQ